MAGQKLLVVRGPDSKYTQGNQDVDEDAPLPVEMITRGDSEKPIIILDIGILTEDTINYC